jgi:hypothetical protein
MLLAAVAWGLFFDGGANRIIINGQELTGPLKGTVGAVGLIVASIALFCAAIFLAFFVAGAGVFLLGAAIVGGLVIAAISFPILLGVLVPLGMVWAFVTAVTPRS